MILIELAFPWQKANANALGIPDKEFPFPTKKRKNEKPFAQAGE